MENAVATMTRTRRWSLWERSGQPPRLVIQDRDVQIVLAAWTYRYITLDHVHALFGSRDNLRRRLKGLWELELLDRPRAQRPLKRQETELIYAPGPAAYDFLAARLPGFAQAEENHEWTESPRKVRSLITITHDLGVTTFLVCLRAALAAMNRSVAGDGGLTLHWDGYARRNKHRFKVKPARGEEVSHVPDALFLVEVTGRDPSTNYLEFDRGTQDTDKMRRRYGHYYFLWRERHERWRERKRRGEAIGRAPLFRVLTVTEDSTRAESLRRAAASIRPEGRRFEQPPRIFWFTDTSRFSLEKPVSILGPIWEYASGKERESLVPFLHF